MPGFLLEDDAVTARKNVFDDWLDEQKRNAAAAAQQVQQQAQDTASAAADQVSQRQQEFQSWLSSQQTQPVPTAPAQPATPTPAPVAPVPPPVSTPEEQQRRSAFDDWLNQRQQDVTNAAGAVQSAVAPALPHTEEPATAMDTHVGAPSAGPDLASRWKTQFDFGQTYTGNYRTGTPHRGVDLVPSDGKGIGTEVDAFVPGKVTLIQRDSGAGGLMVYVQDQGGLTHAYMHLANAAPGLAVGQQVNRGDYIANMGESGTEGSPHLHYEVRKNAATGDPLNQLIDPRPYLRGEGAQSATAAPVDTAPPVVQAIGKGKDAFLQSLTPIAQWASDRTGIDPAAYLAIAANETGWGASDTAQRQNNLFSIQGSGANGSRWAGYESPQAAFQAFNDLISQAPRYAQAWADRHNPIQFINDLRQAGYVVDEPGYPAQGWVNQVSSIYDNLSQTIGAPARTAGQGVMDTLGQGASVVASHAQDLADQSAALAKASQDRAQQAQDLLDQTRQRLETSRAQTTAENDRYVAQMAARRQQSQQDLLAPRRFDSAMGLNDQAIRPMGADQYGFQAPDVGGAFSALGGAANQAVQPGGPVGDYFNRLGTAGQRIGQRAIANPLTPLVTPGELGGELQQQFTTGVPGRIMANDREVTDAAANAALAKAREMGANPSPDQEQALRTAFSAFAPSTLPLMFVGGAGGVVPRVAEGLGMTALSGAGMAAGEAAAPNLPEPLRPFAPLVGGFAAPVAGSLAARGLPALLRGGARAPVAGIVEGAASPAANTTRVYHGTSSEFARPDPSMLSEESMYGPGYYLTDDARVAGGTVRGPEGSRLIREGTVDQRGYAQEAMPPGFDTRALARDEEMATNRLSAAQRDLEYARQNRNPFQETDATRHIEAAQRDLDEIARDRAAAFNEPAGPNVRPVDMPNDLKLLDAERYVPPEDVQAIRESIGEPGRQAVFDRQVGRAFEGRPNGKQAYDALTAAYGRGGDAYATANRILADAGFDGIRYPGGTIMPIVDQAGNAVRHNAYVIFPESLDKLTNATAGTRGGLLPGAESALAPFARRAIGSATGAAVGAGTAPEGATPEERLQRAAVGAGAGLGLATGLESLGLVGRAGVRRAVTAEELRVPTAAEKPNELVQRLATEAGAEEANAEKVFSGPIADRLGQVAQQPVSAAEVEDARQTIAQLAARGERITGVPQQFSTPEGLAQLRARLKVLAEEGASEKDWYSDSSRKILDATQQDKTEAERIAQLVAIYSPNTPVDANLNNALMAYSQWKTGVKPEDFKVAMGAQDKRAVDLLYRNQPWEGRKTNNFYRNLMQHIDDKVYAQLGKETGQSGVTADIWMMRAFDYLAGPNQEGRRWLKAPSDQQYNFIQDEVARLGKQMGWTPEQTQAAMWSSTKAAAEGTGITEAGFHYGSALERRMAQVSYTASPGSTEAQRVPGYMDAPEHERSAYNLASESGFRDPVTGRDQAAEAAGILRGRTLDVPEVYGQYVGPGLQAEVAAPAARASRTEPVFDPVTGERMRDEAGKLVSKSVPIREAAGLVFGPARDQLNAFAAFRGKVLKQDAVPWTRMFFSNAPLRDSNMNQLHIGRPLTTDEAQQLNQALIGQLGGDGKHAVVATPDGAWILNLQGEFERDPRAAARVIEYQKKVPFTGEQVPGARERKWMNVPATREENVVGTWKASLAEDGKPLPFADNPSFNKAVEEAIAEVNLGGDPDAHVSPFRSDGEYVFNDWEANPNGEGYQSQIESSGRAAAFADVEAAITRRVRQAQADTAARFGWPADPTNPFAGAAEPGAAPAERGLPGAAGAEPAAAVGPRAPPEGAGFTAPEAPAEGALPTTAGADIRGRLGDLLASRQGAAADPRLIARLGGAAAGVAGSEATMSEQDKQDPWGRVSRDLGFGLIGASAPGAAEAIARRGGPLNWQDLRQLHVTQQPLMNVPQGQTVAQFLSAFGKNNLLSGPGTQISNIFSQLIELGLQPAKRAAAGYEDEAIAGLKTAGQALPDAFRNMVSTMRTGRGTFEPGQNRTPAYWFALRALGAADDFFRTLGYAMGSGMEGQRFIRENPGQSAQGVLQANQGAINQAGQRTARLSVFGEGNGPGQWLGNLKQRLMSSSRPQDQVAGMALDAGVPFSSVPGRIWTAGIERLPGVAEASALGRAGIEIAHGDPHAARLAIGGGLVSSVINTSIISNIMNGNITGPEDKAHPTSIKINGQWVDYSRWGPYMLPIALPAAWVEAARKEGNKPDPDQMKAFYNATFKTMANQFYAADMIKVLAQVGEGNAASATGQLAGSYIDRYLPAGGALNFATQAWDPILRDTTNKGLGQFIEREQAKIPFLAQMLPAQPSMTSGEPEQRLRSGLGGTLLGMQTRPISDIDAEVNRLEKLGYTLPNPTRAPTQVTVQGARIALSEAEGRELTYQRGQAIDKVLTPLVTSSAFQRLTDDQKARAIASRFANIDNDTARNWERMTSAAERSARIREGRTVVGRKEPVMVGGR